MFQDYNVKQRQNVCCICCDFLSMPMFSTVVKHREHKRNLTAEIKMTTPMILHCFITSAKTSFVVIILTDADRVKMLIIFFFLLFIHINHLITSQTSELIPKLGITGLKYSAVKMELELLYKHHPDNKSQVEKLLYMCCLFPGFSPFCTKTPIYTWGELTSAKLINLGSYLKWRHHPRKHTEISFLQWLH